MFKQIGQVLQKNGVSIEERRRRYEIWKSKNVIFARGILTASQWEEFVEMASDDTFQEPDPEFRDLCGRIDRMRKRT
jgi:hypothetical protein